MSINRIVHHRCTSVGGRYIEVGKLADSGKAFIARYDKTGVPTGYATFDEIYHFAAVTLRHDDRRENDYDPNDYYDNANIFVVGSVVLDNNKIKPLILTLSGRDLVVNDKYVGDFEGYLTDVIMTDYNPAREDDVTVLACGTILNHTPSCLLIVKPLFGPNDELKVNFTEEVVPYYHDKPAHFKKIALDHVGFIVCSGFNDDNQSYIDFDFLVRYIIRDQMSVSSGNPLVELDRLFI